MKNSIKKIICSILIFIAIIGFSIFLVNIENKTGNSIENKTVVIDVQKDKVQIEETLSVKISKNEERFDIRQFINYDNEIQELQVDNEERNVSRTIIENNTGKDIIKNVKIQYSVDDWYIEKYDDVSTLRINICPNDIDYAKNVDVTINLNEPTKYFEIENNTFLGKVNYSKISDKKFNIHINKATLMKESEILACFDSEMTNVGKVINQNYMQEKENNKQNYVERNSLKPILIISVCITIFSYILYFIFRGKKQKTNNIRREWKGLISPVLAESVIDGKIGVNELIMTVITDLIVRGNIDVIDNDTIELVHTENLTDYELEVVNIVFETSYKINFEQIKNIFIEINTISKEIFVKVSKIKKAIIQELKDRKILDSTKKKIMNIMKTIAIVNIVILILAIAGLIESLMQEWFFIILIVASIVIPLYRNKNKTLIEKLETDNDRIEVRNYNQKFKFAMIFISICVIMAVIINIKVAPIYNVIFAILILLDIIFIFISKKQYFTDYGKNERIKILELKNYLEEYSIIKERDIKDLIIWDKYLVYATAFGMPSKIIRNVYGEYMNANIALQTMQKMIDIM